MRPISPGVFALASSGGARTNKGGLRTGILWENLFLKAILVNFSKSVLPIFIRFSTASLLRDSSHYFFIIIMRNISQKSRTC